MNATARNLGELHTNQVTLDTDGQVLKSKMSDVMSTLCEMDSKVDVLKNDFDRQGNDFDLKIQKLTKRIDKAEEDRMDKYYKQVSELQDWVNEFKPHAVLNNQMIAGFANFLSKNDNHVTIYNAISETMTACLDTHQLNNFIDFMSTKFDSIGQR